MIQTPLISTLPQAPSADGSATLLAPTIGGEGGVQPSGEGKAAFSQAMAMAQLMGKAPASQGNPPLQGPAEGTREGLAPAAKSLASDEPATESASSSKGADDEGEQPPDDFLQQLQASLRQDVSLVVPPTSPAMAGEAAVPVDGNPLPPGAAAPGMAESVEAAEGSVSLPQMTPERQQEGNKTKAIPGAAQGASAVPSGQGALPLGAEEPALADDIAVADQGGATRQPMAGKGAEPDAKGVEPPLSGQERAALLAKVVAGENAQAPTVTRADSSQEAQVADPLASAGQGATASRATSAYGDGVIRTVAQGPAPVATPESAPPATAAGAEKDAPVAGEARQAEAASGQGARAGAEPAVNAGSSQPVTTEDTAPVQVAPQILARHESQGAQAPLTALSAGLDQMESAPVVAAGAAVSVKPAVDKSRLDELGKQPGMEVKGSEPAEGSQPLHQAQSQVGENRPLAEATVRREPQSLPHLKLATPEAPEQLHHKVNLMLADKLQQAEIQLDPLGLGKMKIQIQMDASSQASVHFVVQHGQTREMLEQAMPRLRDMLAGQGIQLGQTVVQQQAQQQAFQQQGQSSSQGQSGFGDQGRQGGNGGGSDGREAEGSARNLTLLVESANDAGIDFYA
ncbi:flagellar hook-length control protein FliK [Aeromonas caviae]|uniref:flagellar hook-length control protein FliK n=1 Tax=Aeromonas TaxID=642 RepID=UPI000CDC5E75|nr:MULTISPECIES: flagellar hook-length control protein FliK [Aeromonas]AUZ80740.1 flagellar hook-length control protein FliK [Aeromonas sp. ASNIH1]MDX7689742.1 flagellar hook-length control protein FliK [Aeromonas caviae]MDX7771305.1 flagellar hook-length control protein FliK [Aeromonas caviae]MDX7849160.1 flagellar hook-length control protein FliK [Aeromonas caviae]UTI03722.1 flagellar hook-length control protein FliK [Aeromonas caviae]